MGRMAVMNKNVFVLHSMKRHEMQRNKSFLNRRSLLILLSSINHDFQPMSDYRAVFAKSATSGKTKVMRYPDLNHFESKNPLKISTCKPDV